jgi:quinol monooxygenase YgiN
MVIAILKIKPILERWEEVLTLLRLIQGPTQVKPGCLACELYEMHGDDPLIQYVEHWQTKEHLSRHIQSDLFLRVLFAMELASEQPEIRFYEVAEARGMEFIESLRMENIRPKGLSED